MNRLNYGRRSGVILDVCKSHGAWFDGDELHRVLVWVRDGGTTEAEVRAAETVRRPAVPLAGGSPPLARDETWWRWIDVLDVVDLVELTASAVGKVVDRLRD
jgi:hypothetical protein